MKPNKPGIWEWFEEDGTKRLVRVCDVGVALGKQHLRVAWWGGYYDVHDRIEDIYGYRDHQWGVVEKDSHHKAEWPDRWGKYIGPPESVTNFPYVTAFIDDPFNCFRIYLVFACFSRPCCLADFR